MGKVILSPRLAGQACGPSRRQHRSGMLSDYTGYPRTHVPQLLQLLDFPGMTSRKDNVVAANAKTFQWVFGSESEGTSKSEIEVWLESGSGYYWLSGKAGSGKSTLMHYLADTPETVNALGRWAGSSRVAVLSFFFWGSGKPLQKDTRGLLRACIVQVIKRDARMARVARRILSPSGEISSLSEAILSETKLCDTLLTLLDHPRKQRVNYCLFIDALGECAGERAALLGLLDELIARPHVKVCVTSTRWPSLEQHFRYSSQLVLQSHTSKDILLYVREQLSSHRQTTQDLADRIVSRSGGSFLWAIIATREVREGLESGLDPTALVARLDTMPAEARDLVTDIVASRKHAKEYFSIRSASPQPIDLLTFSVACLAELQDATPDDLATIL